MGMFHYGRETELLEDADLAHLQAVIVNKLRRSEPFLLTLEGGIVDETTSFWIHEQAALRFDYTTADEQQYDRARLEQMLQDAASAAGLHLPHAA